MKKRHSSVTLKIGAWIICALIIYSSILIVVMKNRLTTGFIASAEQSIQKSEEVVNAQIDLLMQNMIRASMWYKNSFQGAYAEKGHDPLYLNNQCRAGTESFKLENVLFFDMAGNQLTDTKFGTEINPGIKNAAMHGGPAFGIFNENGIVYTEGAVPIEFRGEQVAVICVRARVTTDEFVNQIANITDMKFSILDGSKYTFSSIEGIKGSQLEDAQIDAQLKEGKSVVKQIKLGKTDYLADYFPITNDKGAVVTTFVLCEPLDKILTISNSVLIPLMIISTILSGVLLIVFGIVIYRLVTRRIKAVNKSLRVLSSGDADLTQRLEVKGHDEFSDVQKSVNKFIEVLQGSMIKLADAQLSLKNIVENLGTNSEESSIATSRIISNIDSVRQQTINQSQAVQGTSDVLVQSATTVENLVNLVNAQVEGISSSSSAIEQMLGNITSVNNSVKKMSSSFNILDSNVSESNKKIEIVGQRVNQMAQQSETLLQANNMIAKVASQTNLLAMNAAIEAAHAGEAGKGFSVVADEIRKLAETSSAQSKNISVELQNITESIQEIVNLSKDSQDSFDSIVSQLSATDSLMQQINNAMEEQEIASHHILESLSNMKSQASEVNDKSIELKNGIEDVKADMNEVTQISQLIQHSMDEMTSGSDQISNAAQSVSNLAAETKSNIDEMDALIKMFKA